MAVLAGIDEAGFGPILGPLVVSSSIFKIPDNLLKSDLWQILNKSVGSRRKRLGGRLLICDSKKAYNKSLGIKHLERTAITCLRCLGEQPKSVSDLLALLCPDCFERISDYPWYENALDLDISADNGDISIASAVMKDDFASHGIKLLRLKSHLLDVAYYNRMVGAIKNKANVLFTVTSRLIKDVFDNFGGDQLQIVVDRQGGRVHYRTVLQRMFPDMELRILRESPAGSSYLLTAGDRQMRLHFVVKADNRFLQVALASMVSKYLRELLIANINRYFADFHPPLKPTAGYWKDGLRFIEDLRTNIPHIPVDDNQLIRCR